MTDWASIVSNHDFSGLDKDSNQAVRSIHQSLNVDPDRFAETDSLHMETGLPHDVIDRNKEEVQQKIKASSQDWESVIKETPEAEQWIADPSNAKMVSDDFTTLGRIKKTLSDIPKAYGEGSSVNELIHIRNQQLFGEITPEQGARAAAISEGMGAPLGADHWLSTALIETSRNLPQIEMQLGEAAEGATYGILGGAAVGSVVPAIGTAAGAIGGGVSGAMAFSASESFRQQSALLYDGLLSIRGRSGETLDPDVMRGAAIVGGGVNAGFDLFGLGKLVEVVPGVSALKDRIIANMSREGIKDVIAMPGMKAAFKRIGRRVGEGMIAEGTTEAIQEMNTIITEEIAKASSEGQFENFNFTDSAERVAEAGTVGALVGGTIGTTIGTASMPFEMRAANRHTPEEVKAHIEAINEETRTSTLYQRSPERFRTLVEMLSKDDRLYVDSQVLSEVVAQIPQEQRAQLLEAMPDLQSELETASITGADVSIRKADYVSFIAPNEVADVLTDHIKIDPADMSVAERATFEQFALNNPDIVSELNTVRDVPISPEETYSSIERIVRGAMQKAGRNPDESSGVAQMLARTLSRFAAPLGLDANQALNDGLLQFQEVADDGTVLRSGSNFDVMLDDLKKMEEGKKPRSLDDVGKAEIERFSEQLKAAGLTVDQARNMERSDLLDRLKPVVGEVSSAELESATDTDVDTNVLNQDSGLLAPNGQPSNLNAKLYETVRTPEFKEWFGDWENDPENASKVVDENGEPRVVYHGSDEVIDSFEPQNVGTGVKGAYYFSSSPVTAATYVADISELESQFSRSQPNITPVFLSINNPSIIDAQGNSWDAVPGIISGDINDLVSQAINGRHDGLVVNNVSDVMSRNDAHDIANTYVAFESEQIKSIHNEGSFDSNDSRILYQGVKTLEEIQSDAVDNGVETSVYESGDKITLGKIVTDEDQRNRGAATNVMRDLSDYADSVGKTIVLDASSDFGGNKKRLKDFYKRFGFVENKGRNKDYRFTENMYREPALNQTERGKIELSKDIDGNVRKVVISFTERSNFSTAVHEFAHFGVAMHRSFVKVAREQVAAGNTDPDVQRIIDDWEEIKRQVGSKSDNFTVDQEEKLARSFEAYMREGKAPSEKLRRIFSRFRDWLTRVYQDLTELRVDMNDEIRGIFDRWLASDTEIARVSGKNSVVEDIARSLGMEGGVLGQVSDYVNSAIFHAEEKIFKELTREKRARESQAYKDAYAEMKKKVAEELRNEKKYGIISYLDENGMRVYIDPDVDPATLGIPPFDDVPVDAVADVTPQELDRLAESREDAEALRDAVINTLLRPRPKQPKTLNTFLVQNGGVKDEGGELSTFDAQKQRPGLINKNGLHPDTAREMAEEAGYLNEGATLSDFYSAVDEDLRFKSVVVDGDMEQIALINMYDDADRMADELGIDMKLERERRRKFGRYSHLFTDDVSNPNAVAAEEVAELFGFNSGRDMIKTIRQAGDFDRVVARDARARLLQAYPDMVENGRIKQEAGDAIMNDRVLLALDLMVKELGKQYGGNPVSMKKFAKIMAQQKVADIKLSDANYAFRYEVAREKSLREALKHSRAGDPQQAMIHLQRAIVNQTIYKSLQEFKQERAKAEALFKKVDEKDKKLAPRADIDFIGAARYILNKYGLGGERFNINAWMAEIQERDPDVLEDLIGLSEMVAADDKPAGDLTIAEFNQVHDAIKNIYWVARKMREFQVGEKKVQTEKAVGQLVEQMGDVSDKVIAGTQVYGKNKLRANVMALKAIVRRVEHWTQSMDGGFGGPFRDYIFKQISEASDNYRDARGAWIERLDAILKENREILSKPGKIVIPELVKNSGGRAVAMEFRDKMELIGFMLHTGNQSNLEKLLGGYGISRESFESAFVAMQKNGILTKDDFKLVQKLWDLADELKPISQKAHKDLYGYRFEEIESSPVVTEFGTFRGGYWPAIVDTDQTDSKHLEQVLNDQKKYMLASTNKGFTKSRVSGYKKPLSTDLRLASSHIDKVLMFAYIEPSVRQVARVINHPDFKDTLHAVDPEAYSGMLLPWLQRSAQQTTSKNMVLDTKAKRMAAKALQFMRTSASAQVMMGNVGNAVQNFSSFPLAVYAVGPRNFAKAFTQYVSNPLAHNEKIREASKAMRVRQNVLDFEFQTEINEIVGRQGYFKKIKNAAVRHGYFLQRFTQMFVDNVTWMAAYSKHVEAGHTDAQAIEFADSTVRTTQSSGAPQDLSEVEAGSELAKPFLMFYTYFNNIANMAGTEVKLILDQHGFAGGSSRLFYMYMMLVAVPAATAELMVQGLRNDYPEDEDGDGEILDDWLSWFAGSQARYGAAMVPVAGQAINALINSANDKPFDDRISASPIVSQVEGVIRFTSKTVTDKYNDDSRQVRDGMNAIGFVTGLPLGQLGKPMSYIADVNEGDSRADNAGEIVKGLVAGPPKR